MANQRSRGTSGALGIAIRQFVLHGLPTTTTRTSFAAADWIALPVLVKIGPFMRIRSPRSIPCLRGMLPTHSTQLHPAKPSSRWSLSALTTPASVGKAQSSSSISTPFKRLEDRRDFDEMQNHRLIRAEDLAAGDAEDEGITDVAGGTGDGDTNGGLHLRLLRKRGRLVGRRGLYPVESGGATVRAGIP